MKKQILALLNYFGLSFQKWTNSWDVPSPEHTPSPQDKKMVRGMRGIWAFGRTPQTTPLPHLEADDTDKVLVAEWTGISAFFSGPPNDIAHADGNWLGNLADYIATEDDLRQMVKGMTGLRAII